MRLTRVALSKRVRRYMIGKFIDSAKVQVQAGDGANGLAKFGGLGGSGGDVVLEACAEDTLDAFYKRWRKTQIIKAESGERSTPNKIFGHNGAKKVLKVPVGVSAFRLQKNRGGDIIGDLNEIGERLVIAKGGEGGGPSNDFKGTKGEFASIQVDLKLIADIGLVGFPNAGKSTLLRAISKARPKIAAYPFTTVRPEVGIIEYPDATKISMADLPGLLEGAHLNHGLGHSFLRHIERTKLLLLVADVNGFSLSSLHAFRSCIETIILLNRELELYDETLLTKPALLVVNKLDVPGSENIYKKVLDQVQHLEEVVKEVPEEIRPKNVIKFKQVFGISASAGPEAVIELKEVLKDMMVHTAAADDVDDYEAAQ